MAHPPAAPGSVEDLVIWVTHIEGFLMMQFPTANSELPLLPPPPAPLQVPGDAAAPGAGAAAPGAGPPGDAAPPAGADAAVAAASLAEAKLAAAEANRRAEASEAAAMQATEQAKRKIAEAAEELRVV